MENGNGEIFSKILNRDEGKINPSRILQKKRVVSTTLPYKNTLGIKSSSTILFNQECIWKSFNYFKIGLLLGFFIDAYKVGS